MDQFNLHVSRLPDGAWFITSPDWRGLTAVGNSLGEALADVAAAVEALTKSAAA